MKISIIIPVYNVEAYIEKCLTSVFNQTYRNIELILINDCSTDDTVERIDEILRNNNRLEVTILHNDVNKGPSGTRNNGIKAAKGDYLFFLDSDDELALDTIEILVNLAEKYSPDFVIGGVSVIGNYPNIDLPFDDGELIEGNEKIRTSYFQQKWYNMPWNKLFRKEFLLENNLFFHEGIYHEDALWSFEMALVANSMAVCTQKTYVYNVRENSRSTSVSYEYMKDLIFVYNQMVKIAKEYSLDDDLILLDYLESSRFYILQKPTDKNTWIEVKLNLKSIQDITVNKFYRTDISIETKIKWLFLILPSSLAYPFYKLYKKI